MTNQTNKKTYYISTPIYYPSGKLHIGNTYSTVLSDAIARYKRLMGYDVYFNTGTDEHGQKIEQAAEKLHMDPKTYVDGMADSIKELYQLMDISYDHFIRTTDASHEKAIQDIFEQLLEQGDIYLGEYSGWYSVSDEEYFTESQMAEVYRDEAGNMTGGIAPTGNEVQWVKEESYFFRMSHYADRLLKYYEEHPDFIVPEFRKTEMVNNFIKPGLEDLAVSRTTFSWGIPVKSNPKHVVYVWIDALANYITTLGYGSDNTENFEKFWPNDLNVIGKDITRFHTIYWPTILMALDLPLPKQILSHGWLVMKDGKMSKSKGNAVYPEVLIERYGLDATRYYLLSEMSQGNDNTFTPEDFVKRTNTDLANDLGNLLNRTIAMMNKYFAGKVPTHRDEHEATVVDSEYEAFITEHIQAYHQGFDDLKIATSIEHVMTIVSRANKYIDETTPWVLAKNEADTGKLKSVMYHLAETLRIVAHLLRPFLTQAPTQIFTQLGMPDQMDLTIEALAWGQMPADVTVIEKGVPIFPRFDVEQEVAYISEHMSGKVSSSTDEVVDDWDPAKVELVYEETESVEFEQFAQVEMKVAEVIDVEPVEGSNKLLKFRLDAGDKGHRQILSGIAKFYPNYQELMGKKLCIVANLKPRKMMGHLSQGMILSAEKDGQLSLIFAPADMPNGALLG
ncbi:methionine--tRNA ligase [Fundicoccus culcitae]|uniref:Methionine--tRNA ligase n=1 Tax=Fundicoccus culcitae TaxID=2969821 RepID=A0ABY5P398_9LACT|nr:methionine--tRNA ligase [Fundicoccus culcitae]UUX32895.1 methionine--tRNA ligase [Fundicoccus culcitae]